MKLTSKYDKYCDGEYQDAVSKIVEREVLCCASYLVSELAEKIDSFYDEYSHMLYSADYESSLLENGIEKSEGPFGETVWADEDGDHCAGSEQDACAFFDIEPFENEVYEHWIVSDWLASKLEEKGEIIERDFFGFTIWGRCTTGQAIALDRVICDIYDDTQQT